jgi:prevent-host-death family protein
MNMATQNHDAAEEERISVRDANQGFSRIIARVERGERFVVTKNNRPVAHISPAETEEKAGREARRKAALGRLRALMNRGVKSEDGWTWSGDRDALHGRDV